jgi:hypothetical protein
MHSLARHLRRAITPDVIERLASSPVKYVAIDKREKREKEAKGGGGWWELDATAMDDEGGVGVRSISHWSPYDRVGVVNADP